MHVARGEKGGRLRAMKAPLKIVFDVDVLYACVSATHLLRTVLSSCAVVPSVGWVTASFTVCSPTPTALKVTERPTNGLLAVAAAPAAEDAPWPPLFVA